MWPRKLIDISWFDLAFGAWKCLAPNSNSRTAERILLDRDDVMGCLSVRTGFDLLLQELKLPIGSEVVMSAVTIPDMIQIVRRHGLVPVPLDLDVATLSLSDETLQSGLSPLTRLIVVAHLFGVRMPMDRIIEVSKRNNLIVVEDCAQSFCGSQYIGHSEADVSLFSFGPIKTATSLGGALVRVRNVTILEAMRRRHREYPVQSRRSYAKRIMKYALLKLASQKIVYGLLFRTSGFFRCDPDRFVNSLARNFGKKDLIDSIRLQPCHALVAMLERRWETYCPARLERRASLGDKMANSLENFIRLPGCHAACNSHWVFPVVTDHAEVLVAVLREHGFDATRSHNLTVLDKPADDSYRGAPAMAEMIQNVVFVPIYPELTDEAIIRITHVIVRHQKTQSVHRCTADVTK